MFGKNNNNNLNQNDANQPLNNDSVHEVSFSPVEDELSKKKAKKKRSRVGLKLAAILAFTLCISAGSIAGYNYLSNNDSFGFIDSYLNSNDEDDNSADESTDSGITDSLNNADDQKNWIELASKEDALTVPQIVDKVMPSVVGVSCTLSGGTSTGTGIVMSEDGYIITNYHVIDGASEIYVVLSEDATSTDTTTAETSSTDSDSDDSDAKEYKATVVGGDEQSDLAVLKIDTEGEKLTAAEFGDSDDLVVGELAIAIGNPLGFDLFGSVTSGIISAKNREISIEDRTMNLIQTDAAINAGNSGGPLVNCYGQVIGINSVKLSSSYSSEATIEGLGFAIPITEAQDIINDLINLGYVSGRPQLGITATEIDAMTARFNNLVEGLYIMSVTEGSSAEKAGLKSGDVIVGIDGTAITTFDEFNSIKNTHAAGDTVTITVSRSGKEIDIDVVLDEAKNNTTSSSDENAQSSDSTYDPYSDYGNNGGVGGSIWGN